MNDMSQNPAAAGRQWSVAPDGSPESDHAYYARHAAKARELAERATATGARALHLEMAADYDSRAAEATRS
ncbi:hypothetical protein U1839_23145 [Sphingomonas sp. RT2P30]|uniref:hypothetical protein n=1 Tax=Parasphingomonas halimpatiens TaxID=3096162 RepID=UPI002FC825DF